MQSLRTSEYEQFKDRNPSWLRGTCQWILQHEHFQKWRDSSSSNLLWVSADPGCGKSVLTKSLIDEDFRSTESLTTCYFFFKEDNDEQRDISTALSALLHQLFSQKPILIGHAVSDYAANGDELLQSFPQLWNILISAAADPAAGQIVIILDALDECLESGRNQIIDALNTFYGHSTSDSNLSLLKFLVTSRPYFDIERRFAILIRSFPTIRLYGEKESEVISREINVVIKSKVSELGQQLELDDSEQLTLQNELLGMEHRTYLWLKLIVEVIRKDIGFTKKRLKRVIGTLPATVDEAYEGILSKVRDRDKEKVQKLLHIILAAIRPLTLKEMNIALAIEDHHECYDDLDLENESRFGSTLRNLCGLFVSIVDQKIYLIHQTAKEFLVAKSEALSSRWKHSIDLVQSDLVMTRACIAYLMFGIFSEVANYTSTTHELDFLDYASRFWVAHFRKVQNIATLKTLQSVIKVCNPGSGQFQVWFERPWAMTYPWTMHPQFINAIMVGSYLGHDAVVKLLVDTGETDLNSKDKVHGQTPLSLAAKMGHEAVVKLLIDTGRVDLDSKDKRFGQTPLSLAAEQGYDAVVKLLIDTGKVDLDIEENWRSQTPLSLAAEKGHEAVVKLLVDTSKVDFDSMDVNGRTPLWWAARRGHKAIAKLLVDTGKVDVNAKNENGRTALWWAAREGYEDVVKLLIDTGKVDLDSVDVNGRTPLWWATRRGHKAIAKLLVDTGKVDVNAKNENGRTALWWAAREGYEDVVKLLIDTGKVDLDFMDVNGRTPLWWAARRGHKAIAKLLVDTGKVNVNAKNENGRTALWWAARGGYKGVVKLLIDTGKVDLDFKDLKGRTPLWWAARRGHKAMAKLLVDTGKVNVNVNAKNENGRTALWWAARGGYKDVVKLLIDTGKVDLDSMDVNGRTALWWAARRGHKAMAKLLVDTGKVDVNAKNENGRTALWWAARNGHEDVAKLLIDTGKADIDSKDKHGATPLSRAIARNHKVVVNLLRQHEQGQC
jgi:ankyrin repeat protein